MARKPIGVLSRSQWDWSPQRIMGGFDFFTAAAGQFTYEMVFNNATDGTHLYIIAFEVSTSGNTPLHCIMVQGNQGFTLAQFPPMPIMGGQGVLPGQLGHFGSTICVGNHIGGVGNATVNSASWPHDFPAAIVPPGYGFAHETTIAATTIEGGYWWWCGPPP